MKRKSVPMRGKQKLIQEQGQRTVSTRNKPPMSVGGRKNLKFTTKPSAALSKKRSPPKKRMSYSRSSSRSSMSSFSSSDSLSRSYSSYSRSSFSSRSSSTSSTSSSFSSSSESIISLTKNKKSRARKRRSYSKSWSRTPPPPVVPNKAKKYKKVSPTATTATKIVKVTKSKTITVKDSTAPSQPKIRKSNHTLQQPQRTPTKIKTKSVAPVQKISPQQQLPQAKPIVHSPVVEIPDNNYYDPSVVTGDTPPHAVATMARNNSPNKAAPSPETPPAPPPPSPPQSPQSPPRTAEPTVENRTHPQKRIRTKKMSSSHPTTFDKQFRIRLKRERVSHSESSTDEDEYPAKLTLSERFGKLAQLSSQRQEYEGIRMKIVRGGEGGQDKKVYLEGGGGGPIPLSRSPSPHSQMSDRRVDECWLREHKDEYDEYQRRYGDFRNFDPHRDLPRELPRNWEDVNVRYRYYKESGYFGDRNITMEDYLKWEEWWYRYKDWLEKYGDADIDDYRGPSYSGGQVRMSTHSRWTRRNKDDRKRMRYP